MLALLRQPLTHALLSEHDLRSQYCAARHMQALPVVGATLRRRCFFHETSVRCPRPIGPRVRVSVHTAAVVVVIVVVVCRYEYRDVCIAPRVPPLKQAVLNPSGPTALACLSLLRVVYSFQEVKNLRYIQM